MTDCNGEQLEFSTCKGRKVVADFGGGEVSSDGGLLLLGEVDKALDLTRRIAPLLPDTRQRGKVVHTAAAMLRQRLFAIAQGYEDLNDHGDLRGDTLLQTVARSDRQLASPATLCRMENRADRHCAVAMNKLLVDLFIESHGAPPEEVVLDFDATDDLAHGAQEGRFFHGYYDSYCFLPLYVFCGDHPLLAWLRPANTDGARGAWAALKWLVGALREAWPKVKVVLRADSGFCRHRMLDWCDDNGVDYVVGLAKNKRVCALAELHGEAAESLWEETGGAARAFGWVTYAAGSWSRERQVISKAEHSDKGANPRFVVTSLEGDAREIYETVYCPRGEMENRIKEQQLDLFADRTSCHRWWPNQLRLMLSTFGYVLVDGLRRLALRGTKWARRQSGTLRLCLLKVGAVVRRNTRRVIVHLSSSYPYREEFEAVHRRLVAAALP